MSLKNANATLTNTRIASKDGEYRVAFRLDFLTGFGLSRTYAMERNEAMAYYTNDLEDAIMTAQGMDECSVGEYFADDNL